MAVSNEFSTNNQYIKYKITVTEGNYDVNNNSSPVTVKVNFYRTNIGYETYGTGTVYCKINGVTYSASVTSSQRITNSGIDLFSATVTIPHNSDGSKTIYVSAWISHSQFTASEQGFNVVLTTIPRATTPTLSASSVEMGSSLTINTPRASTDFTHTLKYVFGNQQGTIATGVTTSNVWTVPLSLANAIPNATTGQGTILCETYDGSYLVGTKTVGFSATVPSSVIPTISNVSISENVSGIATKFGGFVQNRSKLDVGITASGAYGSTISSYKTYIQSIPYYGNSFTSGIITASGTIGVLTIVTDSRGRTAQVTNNVIILPYVTPTILEFTAYRANSQGVADYEGQYLKVEVNFSISTVNNLNDKYYEIIYRVKGTTTWSFIQSGNLYSLDTSILSGAVFNPDSAYDVQLNLYDYFSGATATLDIPTAFTLFDMRSTGKGIAFGKVSESDKMEVALDIDLTGEFIQEAKIAATLQNSWVNYGAAYESACYWKDKCNVVHLAGLIKSGTTTAETVIFTLPAGYRPRVSEKFFAVSLNAICVIDVYTNGSVAIKTGANSGWLSLSGITFKAEN